MTIFLILSSIIIWSTMFALHWRHPIYRWLDNKFDFERFRKTDKEENNS